jgi:hypothetical protein
VFAELTDQRRSRLLAMLIVSLSVAVGAVFLIAAAGPSPQSAPTVTKAVQFPAIFSPITDQAGAWNPKDGQELHSLLKGGMNLALVFPQSIPSLEAADRRKEARYIDNLIYLIYDNVPDAQPVYSPNSCVHTSARGCVITPQDIAKIRKAVMAELRRSARDNRVVGYYIQDDRIGNTRKLNQDIHKWVAQAGLHRPTICGFGGRLDVPGSGTWMRHLPNYAADIAGRGRNFPPGKIDNYSPKGCDIVALYPFGPQATTRGDAAAIAAATDWKMAKAVWPCSRHNCTLMNFYKYVLRQQGWTPATPIIGFPQTFGVNVLRSGGQRFIWPQPTARQLADETTAFCAAGAKSIIAFTWHDYDAGSTSPYENKKLRAGLVAGVRSCHTIWNRLLWSHRSAFGPT